MSETLSVPAIKTKRRRRMSATARQQRLAAFLFLAPACIMVAIYVIWPIFSSLQAQLLQLGRDDGEDLRRLR